MRVVYIFIISIMLIFNNNCKKGEIAWKEPKAEVKSAKETNHGITANLTLIPYDKFNSINIEFSNLDTSNLLLNDFSFPGSYLIVEKKLEGKFLDISNIFFRRGEFTMIDNIPLGEGDSTAIEILGSNFYYLNRQDWFDNRKKIDNLRKDLMQYFNKKVDMDSLCVNRFLSFLNVIEPGKKLTYPVYINKTFIKGSVYKIYLKCPYDSKYIESNEFCTALFYQLPPIEGYEPFMGNIVSDTLYLNCE